ncbi:MAG: homoserine kinase [Chloroflexota bacterium]
MQKIRIRLPATLTDLGPGINAVGLALRLYTTVEVSARVDAEVNVTLRGEGADTYPTPLLHPVIRAMSRVFQELERAPSGFDVRVENAIPLRSGLGAETALTVAGVIGANNLMGDPYDRNDVIELAAHMTRPAGAVAAVGGGVGLAALSDEALHYSNSGTERLSVVIILPRLKQYTPPTLPQQISRQSAISALARVPLLVEALRTGDLDLLARMLHDDLLRPRVEAAIEGFGAVAEVARRAGALVVFPCGSGPAIAALARARHEQIAEDMRLAYKGTGVDATAWVLPVDTQGIVISAMQSA